MAAFVCAALTGCGRQDDGATAESILARQRKASQSRAAAPGSLDDQLKLAKTRFDSGNIAGAEAVLRAILVATPDQADAIILLANCQAKNRRYEDALATLGGITEDQPDAYAVALDLSAEWLIQTRQYDEAIARLQTLLQSRSSNRVHRRLANLLNRVGRRTDAAEHLRALARSGDISEKELFAMKSFSEPFLDAEFPVPDLGEYLAPDALREAKRERIEGDIVTARRLAERLRDKFPQSTSIAAFLGQVLADLQDFSALQRWQSDLPGDIEREPEYWYALGVWAESTGKHREAVRCFGEVVKRDETDRKSYVAFARALGASGETEAAEQATQRYRRLVDASNLTATIGARRESYDEMTRLATLLDELNRPFEAIAWRAIANANQTRDRTLTAALEAQRKSLLNDSSQPATVHDYVTCGIKLDQWPLPPQTLRQQESLAEEPDSQRRAPEDSSIVMVDVATDVGLDFQYDNGDDPHVAGLFIHQATGGGIGVIDFDLDGWPDVYFSQGGGDAFQASSKLSNQLFRNLSGERFRDVTDTAKCGDFGYGQGVAVADINQDGFPDLVVANIGVNLLFTNQGDGSFSRNQLPTQTTGGEWTTSIACGDLSGDHLPEIIEVNYINDVTAFERLCTPEQIGCNPSLYQPASDRAWQVHADGTIDAWTGGERLSNSPNFGFAAVIAKFDRARGNDLFIANDTRENHFWVSQPSGEGHERELVDQAHPFGLAVGFLGQRQGCMGVAVGDFDRNGRCDLHVTNYWNQPSDLYLQNDSSLFVNATTNLGLYGPTRTAVAWGTQAVDFDRNGWLDMVVLNGHVSDQRRIGQPFQMKPQLFLGDAKGFTLQTSFASNSGDGAGYWQRPALGRTLAAIDWNVDGKPDLVANHLDVPAALLENRCEGGHGLQLELIGTASERDAIGAAITVICGDERFSHWVVAGGFLCSSEAMVDVGLGSRNEIDAVEVVWPNGREQRFTGLAVDRRYLLVEDEPDPVPR
jgi:tetratricopeptide (TPR) repeat protein